MCERVPILNHETHIPVLSFPGLAVVIYPSEYSEKLLHSCHPNLLTTKKVLFHGNRLFLTLDAELQTKSLPLQNYIYERHES